MDAHKNFAYSTVATAPSPASSGTSLVVASGHGARFPAVPFNATVWPAGMQPDPSNAEIVRVTTISTDTFTITRTQEGSSARSIVVGDQIAATITAKALTDVETRTVRVPIDLNLPRLSSLQGNSFWKGMGLTAWDAGHWEFVKDVDGKIYGIVAAPANLAASPAAKIILVIAANATSGVARLSVARAFVADGASLNPGSLTGETAQDITVPGTARLRKDVSFTLAAQPSANDLIIVEVFHEGAHANDTLAVNTELYDAYLEVVVN